METLKEGQIVGEGIGGGDIGIRYNEERRKVEIVRAPTVQLYAVVVNAERANSAHKRVGDEVVLAALPGIQMMTKEELADYKGSKS
jgi:hypothetical protein